MLEPRGMSLRPAISTATDVRHSVAKRRGTRPCGDERHRAALLGAAAPIIPGPNWSVMDAGDFNGDGKPTFCGRARRHSDDVGDERDRGAWVGPPARQPGADLARSRPPATSTATARPTSCGRTMTARRRCGRWMARASRRSGLPLNPGPTWHVMDAGDFNGDGKADILWQNNDGTPAVWLINGTGVAALRAAARQSGAELARAACWRFQR